MCSPESMEGHQSHYIKSSSLIQHSKEESRSSETRAASLAIANLIIQVIVYNQALHASGKWWVPFYLSASVSVAFFTTFATTVRDYLKSRRQADVIFLEQEELYYKTRYDQKQNDSSMLGRRRKALAKVAQSVHYKRYAYTAVVSSALLFFNLLVLYALFFLLPKN